MNLNLRNSDVQQVLRAAAARQSAEQPAAADSSRKVTDELVRIENRWRAGMVRTKRPTQTDECAAAGCIALDAEDDPLFRLERNLTGLIFTSDRDFDEWLSCQQVDDMLSTFERYERCSRGYLPERPVVKAQATEPKKNP